MDGKYDREEVLQHLSKECEEAVLECATLPEALAETRNCTEDKISIIILNTVREQKSDTNERKLKVQTFGNFEVFHKGEPVRFSRTKSKELLAYLIDRRGATVTTPEACGILWEEKEYNFSLQRQFQTVVSELMKSLKKVDAEHIIKRKRNCLSVDVSRLDCDYYRFLEGDKKALGRYNGEYMTNFSWAEMTAGYLLQKLHRE